MCEGATTPLEDRIAFVVAYQQHVINKFMQPIALHLGYNTCMLIINKLYIYIYFYFCWLCLAKQSQFKIKKEILSQF